LFDKSVRIFEEVYERIDEVEVIYLDFAKAFDKCLIKDSPKNYKHVELEGRLGFKAGYQVGGKRWALVINFLAGGQC